MLFFPAQKSGLISEFALPAWALVGLGIAIIIGLSEKRRASIFVDLFILALVGIHLAQILIAIYRPEQYTEFILRFAFISTRYVAEHSQPWAPGGVLAYLWTPFTYALLHSNGPHLLGNSMALFVFGRAVAWRIGGFGFLLLFAAASAVGAIAHLIFYWGDTTPLIGASAGVFGVLGATFRFVPKSNDRLKALFWPDENLRQLPLAGIGEMVRERRSLVYILICIIIFPLGLTALLAGTAGSVAVMAHVGGFAFGVFGFGYFDRRRLVFQPAGSDETKVDEKQESLGLRLLRIIAVIMMILGIFLGVVFYYLQFFGLTL